MYIRQFLFACVLGASGIGAASAMDADSQELGGLQRPGVDSAVTHEVSNNGTDGLGVPHDSSIQNAPASGSSSENCPTGSSTGSNGTQRSRRISLGWQSLLPGSIQ
ncbi:hypothetical protein [Dyella sp. 2RAB6]|uniref:hypothetical protein n=1 Tax=Dyella sp. 2RAB6 TaxID=3232992 RepID=UPI003F9207F7